MALRWKGKNETAGQAFCVMLILPKLGRKFAQQNAELLLQVNSYSKDSIKRAAAEAVNVNDSDSHIRVALDGNGQKR